MALTKTEYIFSQKGMTREGIRKKVILKFMEEKPGPAQDETYNRYTYLVEKTKQGNILLIRPANLKLGFDFRIDVDSLIFRKGTHAPTHIDLFEDLKLKHSKDKTFCDKVINAIIDVINMTDPEEILEKFEDKKIGFSVELLLKLSKWFAVEQDIRYWNGWGRNKQTVWLRLMKHFEFKYKPTPNGFKFYNQDGHLLSEEKAIKELEKITIRNNNTSKIKIPTFLKWAGGKVSLLQKYAPLFPNKVETYFEPFLGSGAVFFHIKQYHKPTSIMISDVNGELINCWNVVKEDVEELIKLLKIHSNKHNKEYYYKIRGLSTEKLTKTERAARLIYLNRTCFNGLYRVNSKGQFNVPMGDYKNPRIADETGLREVSRLIQDVNIETRTYKNILDSVKNGDFVYIDPPYYPISETSSFTSYTKYPFLLKEQKKLAQFCKELDKKGCRFMLSNSNSETVRELYKDFNIIEITAKRMISADSGKRGNIKELVILNYKPDPVKA